MNKFIVYGGIVLVVVVPIALFSGLQGSGEQISNKSSSGALPGQTALAGELSLDEVKRQALEESARAEYYEFAITQHTDQILSGAQSDRAMTSTLDMTLTGHVNRVLPSSFQEFELITVPQIEYPYSSTLNLELDGSGDTMRVTGYMPEGSVQELPFNADVFASMDYLSTASILLSESTVSFLPDDVINGRPQYVLALESSDQAVSSYLSTAAMPSPMRSHPFTGLPSDEDVTFWIDKSSMRITKTSIRAYVETNTEDSQDSTSETLFSDFR